MWAHAKDGAEGHERDAAAGVHVRLGGVLLHPKRAKRWPMGNGVQEVVLVNRQRVRAADVEHLEPGERCERLQEMYRKIDEVILWRQGHLQRN
jgi:hypothetical protein